MALILGGTMRLEPSDPTPISLSLDPDIRLCAIRQQQDQLLARNLPVLFEDQDSECGNRSCLRSDLGHRRTRRWTLDVYDNLIH